MTVFELVRQEVTAKQAAELYGLKIDRNGRGFCPWHDDGQHPALQFFKDGGCYCHSCHAYGDATSLTAQVLGLSQKDAAEQLRKDFHLTTPTDNRPAPSTVLKAQQRREAKEEFNTRWNALCDVSRAAEERLRKYTPETLDAEFDLILAVWSDVNEKLDLMWDEMCHERIG